METSGERLKRSITQATQAEKITSKVVSCTECGRKFGADALIVGGVEYVAKNVCSQCDERLHMMSYTCEYCGGLMRDVAIRVNGEWATIKTCPVCKDRNNEVRIQSIREAMLTTWKNITPAEYQDTKIRLLPRPDIVKKVLNWSPDTGKGLWLFGPTGTGKTRCLYILAYRLIHFRKSVKIFRGDALGNAIGSAFSDMGSVESFMKSLLKPDVLIFDDFGKGVLTERVAQTLFSIIEMRTSERRPIIASTNDNKSSLRQKIRDDTILEPLYRRLQEYTQLIDFS